MDYDQTDEDAPAGSMPLFGKGAGGVSPLSQLQALSGMGGSQLPDIGEIVRPETQHLAFASGMLKPAWGGFGEALSNAFGEQAGAQQKEAELRAKYAPLVAQAQMQRQLQQMQLVAAQQKMTAGYRDAGVAALTGLLGKPGPIGAQDIVGALGAEVERQTLPPQIAQQIYSSLPLNDPNALRQEIQRLSVSRMGGDQALGAVMPKVEMRDAGPMEVPVNVNPGSSAPVGPMGGPGAGNMPKGLAPSERFKPSTDQAGNPIVTDLGTNTVARPQPVAGGPQPMTVAGVKAEEGMGGDFADYHKNLASKAASMRDLQGRFKEMREAIQGFQPGQAGVYRAMLGGWLKEVGGTLGLSAEQSDALATRMAKGDIADAQVYQKLAVQGAMEALRAAQEKGQITQGEFNVFSKNNPSIDMDPKALDKMLNFSTQQYLKTSTELQGATDWRAAGNDLPSWQAEWNKRSQAVNPPQNATGQAKGSLQPKTKTSVGVSRSGRRIKQDADGNWVYTD